MDIEKEKNGPELKEKSNYTYLFKVILVNIDFDDFNELLSEDSSSFRYKESYMPITGVDFSNYTLEYKHERVRLQLWLMGSQEFVTTLLPFYFAGTLGAIIFYEIETETNLEKVKYWFKTIKEGTESIPIALVGHKVNAKEKQEGNYLEIIEFAKAHQLEHFDLTEEKTSIASIFESLVREIIKS